MIGNAGYLMAMEKTGALDCTMYMAGNFSDEHVLHNALKKLTNL